MSKNLAGNGHKNLIAKIQLLAKKREIKKNKLLLLS